MPRMSFSLTFQVPTKFVDLPFCRRPLDSIRHTKAVQNRFLCALTEKDSIAATIEEKLKKKDLTRFDDEIIALRFIDRFLL